MLDSVGESDTIVAAYDLQACMIIHNLELRDNYLMGTIRDYVGNGELFRLVYGEKSANLLKQADEKTIRLA